MLFATTEISVLRRQAENCESAVSKQRPVSEWCVETNSCNFITLI